MGSSSFRFLIRLQLDGSYHCNYPKVQLDRTSKMFMHIAGSWCWLLARRWMEVSSGTPTPDLSVEFSWHSSLLYTWNLARASIVRGPSSSCKTFYKFSLRNPQTLFLLYCFTYKWITKTSSNWRRGGLDFTSWYQVHFGHAERDVIDTEHILYYLSQKLTNYNFDIKTHLATWVFK